MGYLPRDVSRIIALYAAKYEIAPWARDKLPLLYDDTADTRGYYWLVKNPNASDMLEEILSAPLSNADDRGEAPSLMEIMHGSNPVVVAYLLKTFVREDGELQNRELIDTYWICENQSPEIFERIVRKLDIASLKDNEENEALSTNPAAISFLREHPEFINDTYIIWNSAARELIEERKIPIDASIMYQNSDWAIEHIRKLESIDLNGLFALNSHPWIVEQLLANRDSVDTDFLCANPNPMLLDWIKSLPQFHVMAWGNPLIFEPRVDEAIVDALTS